MSNIDKLKGIAKSLVNLLENPEPGCVTWREAVHNTCGSVLEYAPNHPADKEVVSEEMLDKLQGEQKVWVLHNFGERDSWQPLAGIVEELGELDDAMSDGDVDLMKDSIADVMIYMADYCTAMGFDLRNDVWRLRRKKFGNRSLIRWVGVLAHHHLKLHQKIRGNEFSHRRDIVTVLQYICGIVEVHARVACGSDVVSLTWGTWTKVRERDWKKYPETGRP